MAGIYRAMQRFNYGRWRPEIQISGSKREKVRVAQPVDFHLPFEGAESCPIYCLAKVMERLMGYRTSGVCGHGISFPADSRGRYLIVCGIGLFDARQELAEAL